MHDGSKRELRIDPHDAAAPRMTHDATRLQATLKFRRASRRVDEPYSRLAEDRGS